MLSFPCVESPEWGFDTTVLTHRAVIEAHGAEGVPVPKGNDSRTLARSASISRTPLGYPQDGMSGSASFTFAVFTAAPSEKPAPRAAPVACQAPAGHHPAAHGVARSLRQAHAPQQIPAGKVILAGIALGPADFMCRRASLQAAGRCSAAVPESAALWNSWSVPAKSQSFLTASLCRLPTACAACP